MEVTMSNQVPEVPKKQHRNQTKKVLDTFLQSDSQVMTIDCENMEDAKNLVVGAYNMCKRKGHDITIWRSGLQVYMQKGSAGADTEE